MSEVLERITMCTYFTGINFQSLRLKKIFEIGHVQLETSAGACRLIPRFSSILHEPLATNDITNATWRLWYLLSELQEDHLLPPHTISRGGMLIDPRKRGWSLPQMKGVVLRVVVANICICSLIPFSERKAVNRLNQIG